LKRVLVAIGLAFAFELLYIGVNNLAFRSPAAIPLMYMADLLPFALGFGILLRGGIKLSVRRPLLAIRTAPHLAH